MSQTKAALLLWFDHNWKEKRILNFFEKKKETRSATFKLWEGRVSWVARNKKKSAVTRIRTWVIAATTQCTNHYTITARHRPCDECEVAK